MANTILITGASSGIGKATAQFFHDKGWNVVATMRTPEKETQLTQLDNTLVTRLDVTNSDSIQSAINESIDRFGQIDVLVNNAGYGAFGPLEAFSMEKVRRQFDTNVTGLIETTKAVLPQMRQQKSGTIVNISSIGGKMTFPLGSLYHGTKFAVEGISEALLYELEPLGINVKIIEPGAISTDFAGRSFDFMNDESLTEYQGTVDAIMSWMGNILEQASPASLVAEVIWNSVTDKTNTLRYTAGDDAIEMLANRNALDDDAFIGGLKQQFGLK